MQKELKLSPLNAQKFGGILDEVQTQSATYSKEMILKQKYATVFDINRELIEVPYQNQNHEIQELLQRYIQTTNCPEAKQQGNKHLLCFKVIGTDKVYHMVNQNSVKIKDIILDCQQKIVHVAMQEPQKQFFPKKKKATIFDPKKYIPKGNPIKIIVRYLDKQIRIKCLHLDPIGKIKQLLQDPTGVPPQNQKIYFGADALDQGRTLEDQDINENSVLNMVFYCKKQALGESQICIDGVFNISVKLPSGNMYEVSVEDSQYIDMVKQHIGQKIKMKPKDFRLILAGKTLQESKSLSDYDIKAGTLLYAFPKGPNVSDKKDTFIVTIQVSEHEKYQVPYGEIKNLMVKEVAKKYIDSSSTYSFIYANQVFPPDMVIKNIQSKVQMTAAGFTLLLFRSQKYFFHQKVKSGIPFNPQDFLLQKDAQIAKQQRVLQLGKKIAEKTANQQDKKVWTDPKFYDPIFAYTSSESFKGLNKFLRDLKTQNDLSNMQGNKNYKFMCSLIESLRQLPDFIGLSFRAMRNYRFSKIHKKGGLVCYQGFTSASRDCEIADKFKNEAKNYTYFNIKSIKGKNIQDYSIYDEKQVLFLPYTYFFIENIQKHNNYDEVYMTEVPSPNSFQKNTIVWIDDMPQNNLAYFNYLKKNSNLEIIPLTSTQIAEAWMKEFNWLYNWLDIKFKLITDMVRNESSFITSNKPNYCAGIDILQILYNKYKFTTKILIFCGDVKAAMNNIQKRNIRPNRHKMITVSNGDKQLLAYCQFESEITS